MSHRVQYNNKNCDSTCKCKRYEHGKNDELEKKNLVLYHHIRISAQLCHDPHFYLRVICSY